jgi:hypothetical protein
VIGVAVRCVAAVLVCLAVAGCGGGETADTASEEPVGNETIRPDVSAEDCDDPDAALTQAEWVEFCADRVTEEAPPESDVEVSPRGNVVASVGADLPIAAEGDTVTATVTIDAVTVDPTCTADRQESPPENGHFVRLDVRATTAPAGPPDPTDPFSGEVRFSENLMSFVGPDGLTFNGTLGTFSAFTCLEEKEQLPENLGPGQQFAGAIIVDVPAPTGTLIYTDSITGQGWEWNF